MHHHTLTIVLCALISLSETDGRLHRRHHLRGNAMDHHLRDSAASHPDELMALEHSERISETGTCGVPRPQVVHVSDHYPGRYFLPHCTVLHRCGRHAGCCGTDRLRCVAVRHETVVLNFYSVRVGQLGGARRKVEKLPFTNHTECGCAPDHTVLLSRNDL